MTQIDTDGDGISDYEDLCQGYNDNQDNNSNQIPDGCDDELNAVEKVSLDKDTPFISPLNISIIVCLFILVGLVVRRKLSG